MLKKFVLTRLILSLIPWRLITSTCIKLQLYCYGLIWRNRLCAKMIESVNNCCFRVHRLLWLLLVNIKMTIFTGDVCVCTFKIQDTCTKDIKIQKDLDSHITVDGWWYPWMIQWRAYSFSTLFIKMSPLNHKSATSLVLH